MWPREWVEVQLYSSTTAAIEGDEWSAACPGRTLPPGKTRYPFYRRLGGPHGRSGRAENLVHTGIRSRTVQTVAQSLYRLSYPAHNTLIYQSVSHSRSPSKWRHIFERGSVLTNLNRLVLCLDKNGHKILEKNKDNGVHCNFGQVVSFLGYTKYNLVEPVYVQM